MQMLLGFLLVLTLIQPAFSESISPQHLPNKLVITKQGSKIHTHGFSFPQPKTTLPLVNHDTTDCKEALAQALDEQLVLENDTAILKLLEHALQLPHMLPDDTPLYSINIDRHGTILTHTALHSSNNSTFDATILDGLLTASPLPPLPKEYSQDTLELFVSPMRIQFYATHPTDEEQNVIRNAATKKIDPWIKKIEELSLKEWRRTPKREDPTHSEVILKLIFHTKTSELLAFKIHQTSCYPKMDQDALQAVERLKKKQLPTFPQSTWPIDFMSVLLRFQVKL
jgi:hypothetical protein